MHKKNLEIILKYFSIKFPIIARTLFLSKYLFWLPSLRQRCGNLNFLVDIEKISQTIHCSASNIYKSLQTAKWNITHAYKSEFLFMKAWKYLKSPNFMRNNGCRDTDTCSDTQTQNLNFIMFLRLYDLLLALTYKIQNQWLILILTRGLSCFRPNFLWSLWHTMKCPGALGNTTKCPLRSCDQIRPITVSLTMQLQMAAKDHFRPLFMQIWVCFINLI